MGIFNFNGPLLAALMVLGLIVYFLWLSNQLSWNKILLRIKLGRVGDKRAIDLLIERLDDKNKYARIAAIKALGNFGDKRAIEPLIIEAYEKKLKRGDYLVAVQIARELGLGYEKVKNAATKMFEYDLGKGKYKGAISWAKAYDLGDEKIKEAAIKIVEDEMGKGIYEGAIDVAKKYNLGDEKIKEAAIKVFEDKMRKGIYWGAIEIAKKYNLGDEKVKEAAIKVFEDKMREGIYEGAIEIAKKYNLGDQKIKTAAVKAKEVALYEYISNLVENSKCTVREADSSYYNIEIAYNTDYFGLENTDAQTQVPWGSTPREEILDRMANIYKKLFSFCIEKNINIEKITLTAIHGVKFTGQGWFSNKTAAKTILISHIISVDARNIDWKGANNSEIMKIWKVTYDAFPALRFEKSTIF